MRIFVKICGITDEAALDAAVAAGADAIGLVFHGPSPRNLAPRRAAELASRLPSGVLAVAVTLRPEQDLVDRVLAAFEPGAWQSDAEDFGTVRLPPGIRRWPVLRNSSARHAARGRIVFDGPASGRGQRANWGEAAELSCRAEVILGGGLDAENVAAAIAAVNPFGVDVSSGVESAPGIKDTALIRAFLSAARAGARP